MILRHVYSIPTILGPSAGSGDNALFLERLPSEPEIEGLWHPVSLISRGGRGCGVDASGVKVVIDRGLRSPEISFDKRYQRSKKILRNRTKSFECESTGTNCLDYLYFPIGTTSMEGIPRFVNLEHLPSLLMLYSL